MKKLLISGFCLVSFTASLSILSDSYAQNTLMNDSPYVEKKVEELKKVTVKLNQKEIFAENLGKYNSQISKDKTDFKSFYNRGLTYYNYADYLFNISTINKTAKEIKVNHDNYFKYFKLSVEDFEQSINLKPDYSLSYISLARSLIHIDKLLSEMFSNIDKNFKSLGYMEKLANKRSLYTLGRKELERIGRIYNNHLKSLKELESSKDVAKKYAFENIKKANTLTENNPDVFQIYSEYYLDVLDYNKAEDNIRKSLALDPRNPDAYNVLGLVNLAKNNYSQSEDNFKTALSMNSGNTEYIKNLATLYLSKKDLDKTMETLNIGLDSEPQNEVLKSTYTLVLNEFLKNKDSRKGNLNKITSNLSLRKNQVPYNIILKEANNLVIKYDKSDKSQKSNNLKSKKIKGK